MTWKNLTIIINHYSGIKDNKDNNFSLFGNENKTPLFGNSSSDNKNSLFGNSSNDNKTSLFGNTNITFHFGKNE